MSASPCCGLAVSGCGGGGQAASSGTASSVAGDADPGDVQVIDGWVTALRHGDVDAAAGYFAIPSVAENGPVLLHITSLDQAPPLQPSRFPAARA